MTDVFSNIDKVAPGSAQSAANYFKEMWRKTDGDVGDELAEVLVNIAGDEAEEFDRLVAVYVEEMEAADGR